jgi:UDP-glucose:glycoprotein glucosyltransferase
MACATWRSTPDHVDRSRETAAIEDPTIYHPLLTLLSSSESVAALDHVPGHPKSEQSQLETLHDLIISSDILQSHPKFDLSSFEASLALHVAQPKLEAYFQYYRDEAQSELHGEVPDCDNWVLWEGRSYCDAGKLRRDVDLTIEGGPEDDE